MCDTCDSFALAGFQDPDLIEDQRDRGVGFLTVNPNGTFYLNKRAREALAEPIGIKLLVNIKLRQVAVVADRTGRSIDDRGRFSHRPAARIIWDDLRVRKGKFVVAGQLCDGALVFDMTATIAVPMKG